LRSFLFLQEQIKDIIIISASVRMWAGGCNLGLPLVVVRLAVVTLPPRSSSGWFGWL
jgi:hypothetical protein